MEKQGPPGQMGPPLRAEQLSAFNCAAPRPQRCSGAKLMTSEHAGVTKGCGGQLGGAEECKG